MPASVISFLFFLQGFARMVDLHSSLRRSRQESEPLSRKGMPVCSTTKLLRCPSFIIRESSITFCMHRLSWLPTRPTFSQFKSLKLRRSTFLSYIKHVDPHILRLLYCKNGRPGSYCRNSSLLPQNTLPEISQL